MSLTISINGFHINIGAHKYILLARFQSQTDPEITQYRLEASNDMNYFMRGEGAAGVKFDNFTDYGSRDELWAIVDRFLTRHPEKRVRYDGCVYQWPSS